VKGQLLPGLHIKVRYDEDVAKVAGDAPRRVALEIETRPEYASKQAKKASEHVRE
jgi:hypothetical protein